MSNEDRYVFIAECYDHQASMARNYYIEYYLSDKTIDIVIFIKCDNFYSMILKIKELSSKEQDTIFQKKIYTWEQLLQYTLDSIKYWITEMTSLKRLIHKLII
jgi:hypothetical protein